LRAATRTIRACVSGETGERCVKIQVKHSLKTDANAAFKLCTDQKSQESVYARMPVQDPKIKREGRAPNVKLHITRRVPINPPAALRKIVSGASEVSHVETWRADGDGFLADLKIDIKSVPVRISGTKSLQPEKGGCRVEWNFDVTSGVPLLGNLIASFAGEEIRKSLEDEYKVLKTSI
jgi:hypothetical protein